MKDFWNERYSEQTYIYGTEPNTFLVESRPYITKGPVLCLSDGEGRNSVYLAQEGFDVTAVDFSEEAVAKTQHLAKTKGVNVTSYCMDLSNFNIEENYWGAIIGIFSHLPLPLRHHVHRQVVKGLSKEGVFILEAYTPAQLTSSGTGGPLDITMLMTLESLRNELYGLDFIVGQEVTREINEGNYHVGESCVVQVVAQK